MILRGRWLEQLKLQCGTYGYPIFAGAVADASSHPEFASGRQYERVLDLSTSWCMKGEIGTKCACISTG